MLSHKPVNHLPDAEAALPAQVVMLFHNPVNQLPTAVIASLAHAVISSQCVTMAATTAPMATTMPTGPVSSEITLPMPVISRPPIASTGPMAATTAPILTMVSCCAGVRALNLSTSPCINVMTVWRCGASASPMEVTRTSMELFSFSIEPPNPLIMASDISLVVPAQVSRDLFSAPTSSGAVLISASHGAIWFLPKMAEAAASCSDSDSFEKASCSSRWTVAESFMEPSALVTEMPSAFIFSAPSLVGETRRARPVFSELAALSASMPLFAMTPMYRAASLTV